MKNNKKKLKILELTNFSSGICGVWNRVKEESLRLSKLGYEVKVFSSNIEKGTNKVVKSADFCGKIKIKRFISKKLGGESFMKWDFDKEAVDYSPDVIIAHSYRHFHTTKALSVANKLRKQGKKCKVFLVTHAPFMRESSRTFLQNTLVFFYDNLIGKLTLNKFDKIIAITKWEIPHLLKLGCKKEKIVYIPNGIPEEFFQIKSELKENNKILFLGRVSPIKNIEVLIKALYLLKNKEIMLEIIGPAEEGYKLKLKSLVKRCCLEKKIFFSGPVYELNKKIKKIDSASIFVLPSKSEGMPQSLIEAMARKKIVIGSDAISIKELISDGKNGFLFKNNDEHSLAAKIILAMENNAKNRSIRENARKSVEPFSWNIIIRKIGSLF